VAAVPSIGRATGVVGASAPEADATRALYEQYANQIFRYCLHQLGSREEAEDAVQSTFLNAFRGLKRGVVPELESAWLFKIAHNVCLSRRRSSWRRGRVESPHDFEVIEEFAPAPTRQGEELIGLQEVLEGMPENQRRAILLREWQGLSYREIAEEMELTQAAVETLIFRARRSLAQGLEALDAPERESLRRRVRRGADAGGLIAALKTFLGTAAGMKAAATVVAVGSATVIAAAPPSVRHVIVPTHRAAKKPAAAVVARHAPSAPVALATAAATAPTLQPRPRPAPALLASRRTPAPSAHRAAPVETAASVAPPVTAPAPAPPVEAPAAPEPTPPQNDAPPTAAPAQPVAPTPAKDNGADKKQAQPTTPATVPAPVDATPTKDKGKDAVPPAPVTPAAGAPGRDKKHDNGDNGRGHPKRDVQAAPVNATQSTTSSTTSTTTSTTTSSGATATTSTAPPATTAPATTAPATKPAVTTPAPAPPVPAPPDQGHRGHGGGRDHKP